MNYNCKLPAHATIVCGVTKLVLLTEKQWVILLNCSRCDDKATRLSASDFIKLDPFLEGRPGTNVNFTISIISECFGRLSTGPRDFELDRVTCVFTMILLLSGGSRLWNHCY